MAEKTKPKRKILKRILLVLLFLVVGVVLYSAYVLLTLPEVDELKNKNPETTAIMEQRIKEAAENGEKLHIRHQWVPFKAIPQLLKDTVRISEDTDFYHHKGIDYYELKEAIKRNLKDGKKARGGSTITQQLAKNLFLSTEKSYTRKAKEFVLAKKLESHLSKDRIFSLYLNVIEFGKGIFGVEAASLYYFHKSVGQLNLNEIIRLAAVIPKPLKVNPLSKTSRYLKWRANLLLDRLVKYDLITEQEYNKEKEEFKN